MFTREEEEEEEVHLQAGSQLLTLTWWVAGLLLGCPESARFGPG